MARYDFGDIQISLDDPRSISEAITKINLLRSGLNRALRALHEYMLEEGVTIARSEIVRLCDRDKMSGDLWMSVKSTPSFTFDETTGKGKGYIMAGEGLKRGKDGMSYAVYVEFGTGVLSEQAKAKRATSNNSLWKANLKLPGKKETPATPETSKTWTYYNEKDGHYYTTSGQPPKHFMANTMYELWSKAQKKWTELIEQYVPHETG